MSTRRFSIIATSLAALCAALLGLLQSALWNGSDAPWLARLVGAQVPTIAALTEPARRAALPPPVYFTFGRLFLVVYALLALALASYPRLRPALRASWLGLLALAALGDLGTYWLSAALGVAFRKLVFFQVELPALALLLLTVSTLGALRARRGEGRAAWWLAGALPCALVATALLRYLPHGPVLGLSSALALALRHEGEPAPGHWRPVRATWLVILGFTLLAVFVPAALA